MSNSFLYKMIQGKEKELQELRALLAQTEEIKELSRVKVYLDIDFTRSIFSMFYKDTKVVQSTVGKSPEGIAEFVVDFFRGAQNGVDVYISKYDLEGTVSRLVGSIIEAHKGFKVYALREVAEKRSYPPQYAKAQ